MCFISMVALDWFIYEGLIFGWLFLSCIIGIVT
uniref:Uncharacterized protein n=1 Tax=Rhizophora mucronata TaxID=61149 RepID=A0A2P2L5R9_RHIMU